MFLLRIAEALVNSQESTVNQSGSEEASHKRTDHHSTDTRQNNAGASAFLTHASDRSVKSHGLQRSVPSEASSSSHKTASTTVSAHSLNPGPSVIQNTRSSSNFIISNVSPRPSRPPCRGLLYNLLVNHEESDQSHSLAHTYAPVKTSMSVTIPSNSLTRSPVDPDHVSNTTTLSPGSSNGMTDRKTPKLSRFVSRTSPTFEAKGCMKTTFVHMDVNQRSSQRASTKRGLRVAHTKVRDRETSVGCKHTANGTPIYPRPLHFASASTLYSAPQDSQRYTHTLSVRNSGEPWKHSRTSSKSQECSRTVADTTPLTLPTVTRSVLSQYSSCLSSSVINPHRELVVTDSINDSHVTASNNASSSFFRHPMVETQQSSGSSSTSFDSRLNEPVNLLSSSGETTMGYSQNTVGDLQPILRNLITSTSMRTNCTVQLAKKIARPVQARITEWLRQAAEFVAVSTPVISTVHKGHRSVNFTNGCELTHDIENWLSLFGGCWHRLLALSMAENTLEIVVVESKTALPESFSLNSDLNQVGLPWLLLPYMNLLGSVAETRLPDRHFANSLTHFLTNFRRVALNQQEFQLLRHVILLAVHEPDTIPALGLNVIRTLRSSVKPEGNTVPKSNGQLNGCRPCLPKETTSNTADQDTTALDVESLLSGLKFLGTLCPYRTAALFCTHLQNGSVLNRSFLLKLHSRYLAASYHLDSLRLSAAKSGSQTNGHENGSQSQSEVSILEQLFDNS